MTYFIFHIGNRQFAFIYIQPDRSQGVSFDNREVKNVFNSEVASFDNKEVKNVFNSKESYQLPTIVWPDHAKKTNFRMALPELEKNLHSEEQLLANGGLENMIDIFINTNPYPQYVILYSWLTPCKDKCSQMVVEAAMKLKNHPKCKRIPFYLYVEKPEKTYPDTHFNEIRDILLAPDTGIIWVNDPGRRP